MRIALVQITSTNDLDANLHKMEGFLKKAKAKGAELVVFPEMAYFMGLSKEWIPLLPKYDKLLKQFSRWARKYSLALVPGTLREPAKDTTTRYYNSLPFFDSKGLCTAIYRKIFLFKANLPDRPYREERYCDPGSNPAVAHFKDFTFGLSICFDLRFPELFRALKKKGAQAIILPASFTVPTGTAHWEVLVRSRAIENQVFMIAPGQCGTVGDGARTYGRSLVVSPWGEIRVDWGNLEGIGIAELETKAIRESEERVAAWDCRREDLFPIA